MDEEKYNAEIRRLVALGRFDFLVDIYLMASYSYHVNKEQFLSKQSFRELCNIMNKNWAQISHVAKQKIKFVDVMDGVCTLVRSNSHAIMGTHYPLGMDDFIEKWDNRVLSQRGSCEVDFSTD